LQEKRDVTSR